MKKLMSVFVALLMLLSVVSMAFAQDAATDTAADQANAPEADVVIVEPEPAATSTDVVVATEDAAAETPSETAPAETEPAETAPAGEDVAPAEDAGDIVAPQEEVPAVETGVVTETEVEEAGITPDSPVLWGIERALERISLALTLGKSAKAKKGLAHAQERLMEVKTMIAEKKMDKAEKANVEHGKAIRKVKEAVEAMDGEEPEEQLAEQAEIEQELDEQQKDMEQIRVKAKAKLQLTPEQQANLDALVASLKETIGDAKVKIEVKKNKIEIKIRAKTGKSAEEVERLGERIKAEVKTEARENKEEGREKGSAAKIREGKEEREETGDDSDSDSSDDEAEDLEDDSEEESEDLE